MSAKILTKLWFLSSINYEVQRIAVQHRLNALYSLMHTRQKQCCRSLKLPQLGCLLLYLAYSFEDMLSSYQGVLNHSGEHMTRQTTLLHTTVNMAEWWFMLVDPSWWKETSVGA